MHTRILAGGALALLLLTGTASAGGAEGQAPARGGLLADLGLSSLWGGKKKEPAPAAAPATPTQMAQVNDPRVTDLQDQIRKLSGSIEEMNFQILQMQEQMRKQQDDIEFRLQELEGGAPAKPATNAKPATTAKPPKKSEAAPADGAAGQATAAMSPDDQPADAKATATAAPATGLPAAAADPQTASAAPAGDAAPANDPSAKPLGTITFDANGAVTGGSVGDQTVVSRGVESSPDGTTVASLPKSEDPEESYKNAYEYILSGDYPTAEAGFREHISRFPKDARAADSQFWLGEALLGQEKYREAAEVFLAASKTYPKSRKAPDMLLKLGVSLNGMNQHDVACATFGEMEKRYPTMSNALRTRLKQERANAAC